VSPRNVLDAVVKRKIPSPRRESNPRTPIVQTVDKLALSEIIKKNGLLIFQCNKLFKCEIRPIIMKKDAHTGLLKANFPTAQTLSHINYVVLMSHLGNVKLIIQE
jgi:hypothetical protein